MDQGLIATMVEAPLEIQKRISIPEDHFDACRAGNNPIAGNAAGNTVDYFNLSGAPRQVESLPAGFTAKGIVALVFSCIAAFLGLVVISWYDPAPFPCSKGRRETDRAANTIGTVWAS